MEAEFLKDPIHLYATCSAMSAQIKKLQARKEMVELEAKQ